MDSLAAQQVAAGQALERMLTGFYTDSKARKNKRYFENRLKKLEAEWTDFTQRDLECQKFKPTNVNHPYFKENFFSQAQEVYDDLKGELVDGLKDIETTSPILTVDDDGEKQIIRQKMIASMKRAIDNVESLITQQPQRTASFCQQHLANLESYWKNISTTHYELIVEAPSYKLGDELAALESCYQETVVKLMEIMEKQGSFTNGHPQLPTAHFKLPKVTIPTFSGDYLKWSSFSELFKQMIDGTVLPKIEKMFYLKSNLGGEARRLIEHLPVSEEKYLTAWEILCNRYDNQRLIVSAFLNSLLSLPSVHAESASHLKRMHDTVKESLYGIKNLGIDTNWDLLIVHLLLQKIDKETHRLFEQSLPNPRQMPTLATFLNFIEARFQLLESLGENKSRRQEKKQSTFLTTKEKTSCVICKQQCTNIRQCSKFAQLSVKEKYETIKRLQRCINCLQEGHRSKDCTSRNCFKCNKRHHTLLHFDVVKESPTKVSGDNASSKAHSEVIHSALSCLKMASYVFLGTAIIKVEGRNNQFKISRAILDSGSQLNFITERLFRRLGLSGREQPLDISGIGGSKLHSRGRVDLLLKSCQSDYTISIEAIILPEITSNQPSCIVNTRSWPIPGNIELADPEFNTPRKVDVLLGADVYAELMLPGQIKLAVNLPTLQNSLFGWVVLGKARCEHQAAKPVCGIITNSLEKQLERFWELEDIQYPMKPLTRMEKDCEEFFYKTIKRSYGGRFIVKLPFQMQSDLGGSRDTAERRFSSLERRLERNPELKQQYSAFMTEMLQLRHMERIEFNSIPKEHYFLPHHCVLRPESTTTKLRVVFDGSCKTSNNKSLNDVLMIGPTVQSELFSVLLRFQLHRFVMTADISKMYRQILVDKADQNYQLIVWRNDPAKTLECYRLRTVTYGTACAPYLATKVLQFLAEAQKARYPLGSKAALRDFYVDDIITGSNDLNEALKIQAELRTMLAEGGFHLRKWCGNHPALLKGIPKEDLETMVTFEKEEEAHTKSLGIIWYPQSDMFCIQINLPQQTIFTKRTILRDIALIYDPLGLINPIVVAAKLVLQRLWELKMDWDDKIGKELEEKWSSFRYQLQTLNNFCIPRFVFTGNSVETQLHGFADASNDAYGAAVYIRTTQKDGIVQSHLLCARSRVAPLKRLSTPRLELCAAQLMVTLIRKVINSLCIPIDKIIYWTDSTITLSRINSVSSAQFKTFVANRIAYIQEHTKQSDWKHVPTKDNPADILSRGATPNDFLKSKLWFHGPKFLEKQADEWPITPLRLIEDDAEIRRPKNILLAHTSEEFLESINNRNSFKFLQHTVAYINRFTENSRTSASKRKPKLEPIELENSLFTILRSIQAAAFPEEMKSLKKEEILPQGNPLCSLKPFIDEDGLIRVGRRTENSNVDYDARHQILLPYSNNLVRHLIREMHEKYLHAGPQALLAIVRQKFWPLKGKLLTTSIVHNCIRCYRAKPKLLQQIMGPLPKERIQPTRPFTNVGVDFCGPVFVHYRIRGKPATKTYIAVFVCFCTKAVHLELVSDLTKNAFLGALKRFIVRRGRPRKIFCDNATNFVGARNELKEINSLFSDSTTRLDIAQYTADENIEWSFIPPRSPHFGGLWEASVKMAKYHLKRVVSSISLTYEELHTVIVEAESILNSRPLTPLSNDPNDLQALTPSHFLIGQPLTTIPNPKLTEKKVSMLQRKEIIEACQLEFWKRWSTEYLQHLQITTKWKCSARSLTLGSLVLLKDDNKPPLKWSLGRVVAEHKGSDGLTRVVDVKTEAGILRRAIHNLCPLPLSEANNDLPDEKSMDSQTNTSQTLLVTSPTAIVNFVTSTNNARKTKKRKIHPINSNWLSNPIMCRKPTDNQSQAKKIKTTSSSLTPILLSLLVLFVPPITATPLKNSIHDAIEIKPLTSGTVAYFETIAQMTMVADHWNLIAYFKMKQYWTDLNIIQTQINKIKEMCINHLSEHHRQCSLVTTQFQLRYDSIKEKNNLLFHKNSSLIRRKRSPFDFIGMISNKLFGILDQNYADRMSDTINRIKTDENHAALLLRNQTSLIDSTVNLISRNKDFINKQLQVVNENMEHFFHELNSTNQVLNEQYLMHSFNILAIHLTTVMQSYEQTQSELFNIITDTHNGKVNPRIITPDQLSDEIRLIREHIQTSLTLSGKLKQNALLQLYKLMTVQTKITFEMTIFKITIPLILAETFQLLKVTPIPFNLSAVHARIEINAPFLALTLHRDSYYSLSEEDVNRCLLDFDGNYMCNQKHAIYNKDIGPAQCELHLLNQATALPEVCQLETIPKDKTWIQLHNPNSWIFVLEDSTPINLVCGTNSYQTRLAGIGLLTFIQDCSLSEGALTIAAHHHFGNEFASSLNSSIVFNMTTVHNTPLHCIKSEFQKIMVQNSTLEIDQLQKAISYIKNQQETLPSKTHQIVSTSVSFISIGIIALVAAVCTWKNFSLHKSSTQEPQPADIQFKLRPRRTLSF